MKKLSVLFTFFVFFSCSPRNQTPFVLPSGDYSLSHTELCMSFPPVSDPAQMEFTRTNLANLEVTKFRMGESWALREPEQGNFTWTSLSNRIFFAATNGLSIWMTVDSVAPVWASSAVSNEHGAVPMNDSDFSNYVNLLFSLFPNFADKVQFGNEWASDYWFPGTAEDFVRLNNIVYDAVKTHSPESEFVLGGFACGILRFLAAWDGTVSEFYDIDGIFYDADAIAEALISEDATNMINRINTVLSNAHYDSLDIHFYDDVENWPLYYTAFTNHLPDQKTVYVSEFGGPNLSYENVTDQYQADRLYLYLRTIDDLGVPEAYFFKMVQGGSAHPNHSESGLFTSDGSSRKPAYQVLEAFQLSNN